MNPIKSNQKYTREVNETFIFIYLLSTVIFMVTRLLLFSDCSSL